jgi:hypothetical protein
MCFTLPLFFLPILFVTARRSSKEYVIEQFSSWYLSDKQAVRK